MDDALRNIMYKQDQQNQTCETGFPGGHALVIAIAGYPKVSPLPTSVLNDACDIHAILTSSAHSGFSSTNVALLTDNDATLAAIRRELGALAQRAKSDDTVVIFFSGHGGLLTDTPDPASALIPFDCDPENFLESVLSESEFSSALSRIQARRIVVFIDACHSGAAASFKSLSSAPATFGYTEKSLSRLAEGTGRVLIASSRASEFSYVLDGARNSVFTESLLSALRGDARTQGDGLIRVFEVFNHVAEQVRLAVPGRQHPIFKASDLEDNFPIALECGGAKALVGVARLDGGRENWRKLEDVFCDLYPAGPQDQDIWLRAGGDISRLRLTGSGRANWFSALRTIRQGGGGASINHASLIEEALREFPHHQELAKLR